MPAMRHNRAVETAVLSVIGCLHGLLQETDLLNAAELVKAREYGYIRDEVISAARSLEVELIEMSPSEVKQIRDRVADATG